jgi:hypothetical protein
MEAIQEQDSLRNNWLDNVANNLKLSNAISGGKGIKLDLILSDRKCKLNDFVSSKEIAISLLKSDDRFENVTDDTKWVLSRKPIEINKTTNQTTSVGLPSDNSIKKNAVSTKQKPTAASKPIKPLKGAQSVNLHTASELSDEGDGKSS